MKETLQERYIRKKRAALEAEATENIESLKQELRAKIILSDSTQEEVIAILGTTRSTLHRWLTGKYNLQSSTYEKIRCYLNK